MAYLSFVLDVRTQALIDACVEQLHRTKKCDHVTVCLDWLPYEAYVGVAKHMNNAWALNECILLAAPYAACANHEAQIVPVTILHWQKDKFYQRTTSPDRVYHITHSLQLGCAPKCGKHLAALWPDTMLMPSNALNDVDSVRQYAAKNNWILLSGKFVSAN